MKQFKFLAALLIAGATLAACDKDDKNDEPTPAETTSSSFKGTLIVDQNDGTNYTQENVVVDYAITDTAGFALTFYQVSFSERMPVKLDMTIPNVSYVMIGSEITLAGNKIVPLAMGGEFPKYTITNLTGTIADGTLSVSMNCGAYPMVFTGAAEAK